MRRAFLVTGAEISGNRLMVGLLHSAGVWGHASVNQPTIHHDVPFDQPDVALISHRTPDLAYWKKKMEKDKRDVIFLVMVRDPWVRVRSHAKHAGSETLEESRIKNQEDYRSEFKLIGSCKNDFYVIPYECLFFSGSPKRILSLFDLVPTDLLEVDGEYQTVRNENTKWYDGLQ